MRKILIKLVIVIVLAAAMSLAWIMSTRQVSLFVDRYGTIESDSGVIGSVTYEGNGTGGTLIVNDLRLNLDPADPKSEKPHVGTDKEGRLALSFGGKVFPFGPVPATTEGSAEILRTTPPPEDQSSLSIRHSAISWTEPFQFNFMSGNAPSRKRHIYYHIAWKKPTGAKLDMAWRYEQHFSRENDWGSGFMIREGETGLIRVEISSPNQ